MEYAEQLVNEVELSEEEQTDLNITKICREME